MKMQTAKLNCNEYGCDERNPAGNIHQSMLNSVALVISRWRELSNQRRNLSNLSEEQLNDIGLTAQDVRREATKLFWQ